MSARMVSASLRAAPGSGRDRGRGALRTSRVVALALAMGTFYTAQEIFMNLAEGRADQIGEDIVYGAEFWVVWALLAPVVLAAARRWPLDAKPVYRPLLAHAATALGLAAAHNIVTSAWSLVVLHGVAAGLRQALTRVGSSPAFVWGMFTGVIFYAAVVMVYGVLRYRRLYAAEQISAAALEAELSRSKLDTLRSQLRPHFLFNTLNAISVFVTEDAEKARQMILRLSTLLRRSLDEEAHEVPLAQELGFVNDYLEIQRARFGDQLRVRLGVDPAVLGARVPVFLLQPLLENAIEHGKVDGRPTTVELSAGREDDRLRLTVADDGPGLRQVPAVREGVGLANTRARLQQLYGSRATVALGPARAEATSPGARIDVRIPYREASA